MAEWRDLEHDAARMTERAVVAWWREHGWGPMETAPRDGRTETTSDEHLQETLAYLTAILEDPAA